MDSVLLYAKQCESCKDLIPIVRRLRPSLCIIAHPSAESIAYIREHGYVNGYPVLIRNNIYYYGKRKVLQQLHISKTRYKLERLLLWVMSYLKSR